MENLVVTDNIDPDRFVVSQHSSEDGNAIIVYYWAAEFGSNPSDSRRMFWIAPAGGAL